jgi:hypothetical protein
MTKPKKLTERLIDLDGHGEVLTLHPKQRWWQSIDGLLVIAAAATVVMALVAVFSI